MTVRLVPVLTTAPAEPVVTLVEAKAHLRVDHSDEDTLIGALIDAATARVDGWSGILGRCLVTQSWRFDFAGFCTTLRLPMGPVQSITSIVYTDSDGAPQTIPSGDYRFLTDSRGAYVTLTSDASWPAAATEDDAVRVTAVLGYGDAEDVPAPIKAAILLMVGDLYRFTETATAGTISAVPVSTTVDALLAPYRAMVL